MKRFLRDEIHQPTNSLTPDFIGSLDRKYTYGLAVTNINNIDDNEEVLVYDTRCYKFLFRSDDKCIYASMRKPEPIYKAKKKQLCEIMDNCGDIKYLDACEYCTYKVYCNTTAPLTKIYKLNNHNVNCSILSFIDRFRDFENRSATYHQYLNGYCWHFAHILKNMFKKGKVCLAYPVIHFVYVEDDIAYDISGVTKIKYLKLIPEEEVTSVVQAANKLPTDYDIHIDFNALDAKYGQDDASLECIRGRGLIHIDDNCNAYLSGKNGEKFLIKDGEKLDKSCITVDVHKTIIDDTLYEKISLHDISHSFYFLVDKRDSTIKYHWLSI